MNTTKGMWWWWVIFQMTSSQVRRLNNTKGTWCWWVLFQRTWSQVRRSSPFSKDLKTCAAQSNCRGLKTCYTQRTWVEVMIKLKDAGLEDVLLYDAKYPHVDIWCQVSPRCHLLVFRRNRRVNFTLPAWSLTRCLASITDNNIKT